METGTGRGLGEGPRTDDPRNLARMAGAPPLQGAGSHDALQSAHRNRGGCDRVKGRGVGVREGGREGGREGEREGGRDSLSNLVECAIHQCLAPLHINCVLHTSPQSSGVQICWYI